MHPPSSLREKAAQLIFIRFGSNMSPKVEAADDLHRVSELVTAHGIGGVLFFNGGTTKRAAESLAALQAISTIPLLVAADMERGMAQQISDLTAWPHALAFDACGQEAESCVEQFAWVTGLEARNLGVHASFSPVADIHRNPNNPIIANRAFARTPARAAALASAYVRGCRRAGLLCCAKHFPGHGNTHEDSHAALPVVSESLAELQQTDLAPFRQLVESGVDMIMTAHVAYPALDPTGHPATLSHPILTGLLRDSWGFQGAVVSDSLKMDGATGATATEGELAVRALSAGVDLLLDVSNVSEVLDAIESAAQDDAQVAQRVEAAFSRAWQLKRRAMEAMPEPASDLGPPRDMALQIARSAVRVLENRRQLSFPLPPDQALGFLLVNPLGDNAYTKTTQIVERFQRGEGVAAAMAFGPDATEHQGEAAREAFAACDTVVIALVIKPFAWHAAKLPDWQVQLIADLCASQTVVIVSLGIEETLQPYTHAAALIVTESDAPVSQDAVTEYLLGKLP